MFYRCSDGDRNPVSIAARSRYRLLVVLSVGVDGLLPEQPTPHVATLRELHACFVEEAPFRKERELIFNAFRLHRALVRARFHSPRFLINGGFTTHKSWAAPADVDVAVVVSPAEYETVSIEGQALSLWTLQGVSVTKPSVSFAGRIQPLGGLVDSFFVPEIPEVVAFWHDWWSRVRGEHGNVVPGARKGYVEVTP